MVNVNRQMYLSDGTPVEFVKTTSRGNVQVRLPVQHPLAVTDALRIFSSTTGRSTKSTTGGLTLTNTAKVNPALPMELSDGTPVNLIEVTSKGNIKVRLPASHALGRTDLVRIFKPNGLHYKGLSLGGITLKNVIPPPNPSVRAPTRAAAARAARAAAPAPAPALAAGSTYSIQTVTGTTLRNGFSSYAAAETASYAFLSSSRRSVNIVEVPNTSPRIVGTVGVSASRR